MRRRQLAALAASLALAGSLVETRQAAHEYEVKAAFLLNFSRYVQWPPARLTTPFQLCVLGTDPFGSRLDLTVDGEGWHGEPIVVRRVRDVPQAHTCHLLFVPQAMTERFLAHRGGLAGHPVLTVGETPAFLADGGMIQLFVEDDKVRFSINQRSAEAEGLQISSRLLRLARMVINVPTWP